MQLALGLILLLSTAVQVQAAAVSEILVVSKGVSGVRTLDQYLADTRPGCEAHIFESLPFGFTPDADSYCTFENYVDGAYPAAQPFLLVYQFEPDENTNGIANPKDKPVVFVNGFNLDIAALIGDDDNAPVVGDITYGDNLLTDTLVGTTGSGLNPLKDLVDEEGYTLYFVDVLLNRLPIGQNAWYLEEYILDSSIYGLNGVAAMSGEDAAIIGWSMGGLISRMALARMDQRSRAFPIDTYISYDSPHRGAFIPTSVESYIRSLSSTLNGPITYKHTEAADTVRKISGVLDFKSSREMLGMYLGTYGVHSFSRRSQITQSPNSAAGHPDYYTLRDEFASNGNYPTTTRNVAFSSGNPNGQIDPLVDYPDGAKVGEMHIYYNNLLDQKSTVHQGYLYLESDNESRWSVLKSSTSDSYTDWSVPEKFSKVWASPGGGIELFKEFAQEFNNLPSNTIETDGPVNLFGWRPAPLSFTVHSEARLESSTFDRVTFVPTLSAIDVDADDFYAPAGALSSSSPFDQVYFSGNRNVLHREMTNTMYANLVAEISRAPKVSAGSIIAAVY